ncbi:MAG: FAD-binding oxidoreductase [Epsilonproteobacteria bacterium]|nr:FAD-binding oxidoreductase [Campylobacterota bacterium]
MLYDVAIIGAGINGCSVAYRLHQAGLKIALFDANGIAGGGSGAAGAFLSPKFSKAGELKELVNSSLDEALPFYTTHFPDFIQNYHLLHIAKDPKDAAHLRYCRENDNFELLDNPPITPPNEHIYTTKSALVDAKGVCEALVAGCDFVQEDIKMLRCSDDVWHLNSTYKAKKVILSTGAYEHNLIDVPYQMVRGIWGHRIDLKTTTKNDISIHQFVSISPTKNSILAIGATHNVHYHPQKTKEAYDFKAGREELLQKASKTIELKDVEVVQDYVGLRSGSFDYLPIVGQIVDVQTTLKKLSSSEIFQKKLEFEKLHYYKNLYMINGSAGYGFVLAPYLSRVLAHHIVDNTAIPKQIDQARFFHRWAKRKNNCQC